MTQEEKLLLLVDLSARLPYGVKFGIGSAKLGRYNLTDIDVKKEKVRYGYGLYTDLKNVKPYLRPMSSMTEKEDKEWKQTFESVYDVCPGGDPDNENDFYGWHDEPGIDSLDWLNAHHFDYRGLIDKGLALEAPEEMY